MVYILHNQTCNCATVMLLTDFVGNRIGKLIVSGRLSCCYYQPLQQKSKLLYVQMKYYKKYAYILPCSCTLQNNKYDTITRQMLFKAIIVTVNLFEKMSQSR